MPMAATPVQTARPYCRSATIVAVGAGLRGVIVTGVTLTVTVR
jgi:hypothetical protein